MARVNKRWRLGLLLVVLAACIIAAASFSHLLFAQRAINTQGKTVKTPSLSATVTIPVDKNLFEPFILPVQPGTTVTWQNNNAHARMFATTPDHNTFLNPQGFAFDVSSGQHARFIFTKPGLYHYYETRLDSWNSTFSRVVAGRNKINYPLSMEGVIWVQGPIANLPSADINFMLNGHDVFATEFLAIARGGAVTWRNLDQEVHFIGLVGGWSSPVNPVDIGLYRLSGTDTVPGGEFTTVLFDTPGLYYYYSRNHDQVDPGDQRVVALNTVSEFPIPMEGFVLVV